VTVTAPDPTPAPARIAAPAHPSRAQAERSAALRGKSTRTSAETRELVDFLVDEVAELRARLDRMAT
jgi:type II secretory pathway component HofQ